MRKEKMQSRKALTACTVVITLFISVMAPGGFGQSAIGDWTTVQSLSTDDEIAISLKNGKDVKGKFLDAVTGEVTIIRKGKKESFAKDSIAQIHHLKRKAEKGKFALIGAGIGAGTGLGIGAAKNSPPIDDGGIYPIMGSILGAGIGAVGGFLFGQAKRKRVLIYQG
jgi:hypothetical protein